MNDGVKNGDCSIEIIPIIVCMNLLPQSHHIQLEGRCATLRRPWGSQGNTENRNLACGDRSFCRYSIRRGLSSVPSRTKHRNDRYWQNTGANR